MNDFLFQFLARRVYNYEAYRTEIFFPTITRLFVADSGFHSSRADYFVKR